VGDSEIQNTTMKNKGKAKVGAGRGTKPTGPLTDLSKTIRGGYLEWVPSPRLLPENRLFMSGDALLFNARSFFAGIIRAVSSTPYVENTYSHMGLLWIDTPSGWIDLNIASISEIPDNVYVLESTYAPKQRLRSVLHNDNVIFNGVRMVRLRELLQVYDGYEVRVRRVRETAFVDVTPFSDPDDIELQTSSQESTSAAASGSGGQSVVLQKTIYSTNETEDAQRRKKELVEYARIAARYTYTCDPEGIMRLVLAAEDFLTKPYEAPEDSQTMFCSELATRALQHLGIIHPGVIANEITPTDYAAGRDIDRPNMTVAHYCWEAHPELIASFKYGRSPWKLRKGKR